MDLLSSISDWLSPKTTWTMPYGKQEKASGSGDPLLFSAIHKLFYGLFFAVISGCFALLLSSDHSGVTTFLIYRQY
jgi:hypothetical protein